MQERKIHSALIMGMVLISFFIKAEVPTDPPGKPIKVPAILVDGDTLAYVTLPDVIVEEKMSFKTRRKYAQWTRLKYNVKKVYPYAILASVKLKEYERILDRMPNEKIKKTYMKVVEDQLKVEFEDELKNLTITQGRILMKLIDRETGHTTYELVKQLRGNFEAFMWQTLAKMFGSDMKEEYDAVVDDKLIEIAIQQIEAGQF
jgi:hypothetical protein